jgi:hypothetical protein
MAAADEQLLKMKMKVKMKVTMRRRWKSLVQKEMAHMKSAADYR